MIAIINYEAGNLTSVWRAFNALNIPAKITSDHQEILNAERVVFPGVGNARAAMHSLNRLGLDKVIRQVWQAGIPLLGICLGSQIILEHSEEGDTPCLGLIPGQALRFPHNHVDSQGLRLKVPHMGWNSLQARRAHPLLQGVDRQAQFYFVHSYYPAPTEEKYVLGQTEYGFAFSSMLAWQNLAAAQFHPEKSGRPGLQILANFARWQGKE